MKILIVDDSELNRMVLKELLKKFQKASEQSIVVNEAEDGLEAVSACKDAFYDLIFMDIMMPRMDGVKATEIIHCESPKTMIIAISHVDDDVFKHDILRKGAEDYIQKPVNREIFLKRMAHYAGIISTRSTLAPKRTNIDVINPFDRNIYSRRMSFLIFDQVSLNDFWDYLMRSEHNSASADLIRLLYGIGVWQLKLGYKFYIFMEESVEFLYFTMTNVNLLNHETLMHIIAKNYPEGMLEISEDRLSFCISKTPSVQNVSEQTQIKPSSAVQKTKLQVFDFIDDEDLKDVLEINERLRSLLLPAESSYLELEEIDQIADYLQKFGKILSSYNEIFDTANTVRRLGIALQDNAQAFKERSGDMARLCQAFNADLEIWVRALFMQGAPSIDFMDQSLISDADMLINILQRDNKEDVDFSAIFDF